MDYTFKLQFLQKKKKKKTSACTKLSTKLWDEGMGPDSPEVSMMLTIGETK